MKRRRMPKKVLSLEVSDTFCPSPGISTAAVSTAGAAAGAELVVGRLVSSMEVFAETISGVVDAPVSVPAAEVVIVSSTSTLSLVFFLDSKPMVESGL